MTSTRLVGVLTDGRVDGGRCRGVSGTSESALAMAAAGVVGTAALGRTGCASGGVGRRR